MGSIIKKHLTESQIKHLKVSYDILCTSETDILDLMEFLPTQVGMSNPYFVTLIKTSVQDTNETCYECKLQNYVGIDSDISFVEKNAIDAVYMMVIWCAQQLDKMKADIPVKSSN